MDRQGFNNNSFPRGGAHARNNNGYYQQHNNRSQHHHHHHAPRQPRSTLHQLNHQIRHNHPNQQQQQPQQPQQPQQQHHQQQHQQHQQQQNLQGGMQYSQYHYYAPPQAPVPAQMTSLASVPNSTLSPDAQEFIPSSFMAIRDSQFLPMQASMMLADGQHQLALQHSRNPHQAQHHMQAAAPPPASNSAEYPYNNIVGASYDEEEDPIIQLQMFITDVTLSPETFDSKLNDLLVVVVDEIVARKNPIAPVVSIIFQAGVVQQNFRYSGARLCECLCGLIQLQGKQVFRDCLLEHAYKCLSNAKPIVGDKEQDKETRGTVLFCAELLFQLEMGYKLNVSDMGLILCNLIKQLILCNEKENQKSGIQALKLCGANLEKMCELTDAMDDLLAHCKAVEEQDDVDPTIQFMLARLPQLRKTNWNYAENKPAATPYAGEVAVDYNQMPVMYGPDGQPISEEELGFLNGINNAGTPQFAATPQAAAPSMDDEALEAYEMFLQETGQK